MKTSFTSALVAVVGFLSITSASVVTESNRVVLLQNLPSAGERRAHAFCNVRGKLAVIGGQEGSRSKRSYFYNGLTNSWEDFGFLPRNFSRIHHVQCVQYKNGLILAGGFLGDFPVERPTREVIYWNLKSSKFIVLGQMPSSRARGSSAITLWDNKLYYFGGSTFGHGRGTANTKRWTDAYNPTTQTWTKLRSARSPRDHHGVARIGEKAYVAGGRLGGAARYWETRYAYKTVEIYNLRTGRWGEIEENTLGYHPGSTPAACGPLLVLAGGEIDNSTDDIRVKQTEVYNTAQRRWLRRQGGRSLIAQFAGRYDAPLATCNRVVYRAAGAMLSPDRPARFRSRDGDQLEGLLLDGVFRRCRPASSFWQQVSRSGGRLTVSRV